MRRRLTALLAGLLVVVALSADKCSTPDPAKPGTITDRVELTGRPGGEGADGKMIRLCVSGGQGCNEYKPSEVKRCTVGAQWPACKEQ